MEKYAQLLIFAFNLSLAACSQQGMSVPASNSPSPSKVASSGVCTDNRVQQCPDTLLPVCAIRDTGVRCITTPCPSSEYVSYDSACKACADERVRSWTSGACKPRQSTTSSPAVGG